MKVLIKRPHESLEVIEVSGLKEINKLTHNVDENGEGYETTGTDSRQGVFDGIDIYMNERAIFNSNLPENFWSNNGMSLYCGNVIFAGYDPQSGGEYGVCSLTDEQIAYIRQNISKYYDIWS